MRQDAAVKAVAIIMVSGVGISWLTLQFELMPPRMADPSGLAETWSSKSNKTRARAVFYGFGPCRSNFGGRLCLGVGGLQTLRIHDKPAREWHKKQLHSRCARNIH